jgi:class 3 adenylate cyclase
MLTALGVRQNSLRPGLFRGFATVLALLVLADTTLGLLSLITVWIGDPWTVPGTRLPVLASTPYPAQMATALYRVMGVAAGVIALTMAWKLPGRPDARALTVFFLLEFAPTWPLISLGVVSEASAANLRFTMAYLGFASLVRFAALFPRPLTAIDVRTSMGSWWRPAENPEPLPARRWARLSRRARTRSQTTVERLERKLPPRFRISGMWTDVLVVLLRPGAVWALYGAAGLLPAVVSRAGVDDLRHVPGWPILALAYFLAVNVPLLAMPFYAWIGWHGADPAGRRRILWLVQGVITFFWMVTVLGWLMVFAQLSGTDTRSWGRLVMGLPLLVLLVSIGVATFYHGALDPRLAIRRTTIYGVVGLVLVSAFVVAEGLASGFVAVRLRLPEQVGMLLPSILVALAFAPVRNRVERGVNRWIDRLLPATTMAEEGERRMSVVAFSDLAGFTRMAATNQNAALTLAALLHAIARQSAERHDGRLVKTVGDGVLFEFRTAEDALATVQELTERYRSASRALELPAVEIQTGMHWGEVVLSRDGDIFGDTVNVAARLEATAPGGTIAASEAFVQKLSNGRVSLAALSSAVLDNVPTSMRYYQLQANLDIAPAR